MFELLATVAGQILQDAGSEDPSKANQIQEEASKEKSQSDLDSQVTSLGSVKDFTSVDKPHLIAKPTADGNDHANGSTVEDVSVQGSNGVETVSCGVRTPSQEDERKGCVQDLSASEGNGALVNTNTSALEEQVSLVTTFVVDRVCIIVDRELFDFLFRGAFALGLGFEVV